MTAVLLVAVGGLWAQDAYRFIANNRNFSASNFCVYPDSTAYWQTAPPAGKRPFYLSHYGRHGSRYLNNRIAYDIPFRMLCKADSMGQLTALGKSVKHLLQQIISDSEGQWGDLTDVGKQQLRNIARRMTANYPEIFEGAAHIQARSTTVNRCVMSMGTFLQQLTAINPKLQIDMDASRRDLWYLNHQDRQLRDSMKSERAQQAYNAFSEPREKNPRLMQLLFTQPDSLDKSIQEKWLNYYLIKTALIQQNIHAEDSTWIFDLFTNEDLHQFWQIENAWWYTRHGSTPLNGGCQPFTQRYLLRKMINEADSCIRIPKPGAQLRFGHETVILPLVCLLGIIPPSHAGYKSECGFNFSTSHLETLEQHGWWSGLVFPMASNIQLVFYRRNTADSDVVFKVLLNEQEVLLPIQTDIAPYYHWSDFRRYYLKMLDDYEKARAGK